MAFGDFCQLADVKAWLSTGQQPFPTTDDAMLSRLITAASEAIKDHLSRPIIQQDWIEQRDGVGLLLNGVDAKYNFAVWPVTAVALVQVNGQTIPPIPAPPIQPLPPNGTIVFTAFNALSQAGYTFTPTQLIIRGWPIPRLGASVILQYTAGYPATAIPAAITQACIEHVAHLYRERGRIGEQSKHLGDGSTVTYRASSMPNHVKTKLSPWVNVAPVTAFVRHVALDSFDPATLVSIAA